ncbi:MAG: hypothetical protein HONBIEJF_02852 [Fimbriimonadaceae bacterium]|nr:hypothetical protein [Fimbriimonadaceae bacterium]
MTRRTIAIALGMTPGIGSKTVVRVLARNDLLSRSPESFMRLSREALQEEYRLKPAQSDHWCKARKRLVEEAAEIERQWDARGLHLIHATDAHFPSNLEKFDPDPPGVLFAYGNLRLLEANTVAVLASRSAPQAALNWIEDRVERLVLDGRVLIAGHDKPAYQRAALVPLRWGAPRVLVLDTGLFESLGENLDQEPFAAARLWRYQFDPRTDLAISAVPPARKYHPNANRVRDRLVAGLAQTLVFAWIDSGGNMDRIHKQARRCGRPAEYWPEMPGYSETANEGVMA